MYFGPLRSLLHQPEVTQSTFDDVLRHLLNWSWEEDPVMLEQCLAYASQGLERWPDQERGLYVTRRSELFLEHVFDWQSLLRGVAVRRAPRFVGRLLEALDVGGLRQIRYLHLHHNNLNAQQALRLGEDLTGLEGVSFMDAAGTESALEVLLRNTPQLRWLSALVPGGGLATDGLAGLNELEYLRVPLRLGDVDRLDPQVLPSLRWLDVTWVEPEVLLHLIEFAALEEVIITGLGSDAPAEFSERIERRGWGVEASAPLPFLSVDVPSGHRFWSGSG